MPSRNSLATERSSRAKSATNCNLFFGSTIENDLEPDPMPNDLIVALLMRRRPTSADVPYAFLVLTYGNEVYQVFLPSPTQDRAIHAQELSLPAPTSC